MIDLLPTEEQQALADAVSGFLRQELPVKRVRELTAAGPGIDADLWRRFAAQGWFGLGLPADAGGIGYGPAEQALIFRELGRHLTPGPVLGTVIAAHLAAAAGSARLLADLLEGEVRANLASPAGSAGGAADSDEVVIWQAGAARLLVLIDPGTGRAWLFDLQGTGPGDRGLGEPGPSIDPAHRILPVRRAALPAPRCASQDRHIVHIATGLLAALLCGIAEAERDMNAEYAGHRVQFGRPIGSFQAVKHRAAESAVRAESAWCQTVMALLHCTAGAPDADLQIASAKVVAAEAAVLNGRDNIQNHGAIGFTAEHDAHLFLKRAHLYASMLGDPRHHLAALFDAGTQGGWA